MDLFYFIFFLVRLQIRFLHHLTLCIILYGALSTVPFYTPPFRGAGKSIIS